MPQKTNLNISPYFDDFNADKNFYRVLFKPGYPVQARELTTLQSILQHQIETFGSHIFKEGSMVIPGSVSYDDRYFSVKINQTHLNLDVSLYLSQLVGKRVKGQDSGIVATIQNYSIPPDDNVTDLTLYVKYTTSGSDFETSQFIDSEILILQDSLTYGNTTINVGDTVATLISTNASTTGSAVGLSKGVYFIRGTFVDVPSDAIVLDPYTNTPSYRVGLSIYEEIVTSDDDNSLNDNAKGFSNYTAPGADRFKISTKLSKKAIDDFDDINFVELVRIDNGEIKKLQNSSVYSTIKDYFAKRTFEESGNYSLDNFKVDVLNSLNDKISNNGVYLPTQKTDQGTTPSDNLMCIKISPGTAYVRGFDIDLPGSTILDAEKPRTTQNIPNSSVAFEFGNLLRVNNAYGTPIIGINDNTNIINLLNRRKQSNNQIGAGNETIGQARIYSYNLTDSSYSNNSTNWDLHLFDIQTYTKITVNENLSGTECPKTTFIKGISSGASGYATTSASGKDLLLSQTSGTFIVGEQISINGVVTNSRSITNIKSYSIDDIKAVYQDSPTLTSNQLKTTFIADTELSRKVPSGFSITDQITVNNTGIATCPGKFFLGIRSDAIIRYQRAGLTTETYNRVVSVSPDGFSMTVAAVTSIAGICDGGLPSTSNTTTFSLGIPSVRNSAKSNRNIEQSSLYVPLTNTNVSSVNLASSTLTISTQIRQKSVVNGELTVTLANTGIASAFFVPFDAERYSIHYNDGTIEPLTSDQFNLENNGTQVTFTGLSKNSASASVTANVTLEKQNIKAKNKIFTRSEKVIVNKTAIGIATNISGLTTSQYYGLRVEDEEISLNLPDAVNIVAIYESLNTQQPVLDKLTFVSGLNLDTTTVLGEKIIGEKSSAVAQVVTRTSSTEIEFVYLNDRKFQNGENVTFEESNLVTSIQSITTGSYLNLTNKFVLNKGQKNQFYDYSRIVRIDQNAIPSKQLLIIFNYYNVATNDSGDIVTANSYSKERFAKDVPILENNYRASDTLDFRPRVSKFTSITKSPFDFSSRSFTASTISQVITPNENSIIGYDFYLPRIDKLVLNKKGEFSLIKGVPSLEAKEPLNVEEVMDIARINLPAYLYDPRDASISLIDNRRYTMSDIRKLEDRIENLEITTSLTLLELNAKTTQVQDADGLSRFKTGFVADDFKNRSFIDDNNPDVNCEIDKNTDTLTPKYDGWSIKPVYALASNLNVDSADLSQNTILLDSNVKKTGNLITLDYKEKGWIEQPFASQVENVNPFNVVEYTGTLQLMPSFDQWTRNVSVTNINTTYQTINTQRDGNGHYSIQISVSTTEKSNTVYEISKEIYARSRNVEFKTEGLKALTRHYAFIDKNSSIDIVPKLIEINMTSGSFSVGEDVIGYINGKQVIKFRLAKPNHKSGTYNNPTRTYSVNPYQQSASLPSSYSASSTILNIDTYSLAEESITKYGGYITSDVKFIGQTSKAVAKVSDIKLISDDYGDLIGTFFIRDALASPAPLLKIKTGDAVFKVSDSSTGSPALPGELGSNAEATYSSVGTIQTATTTIDRKVTTTVTRVDPLAQSFTVDETGAFLTSVDVYFGKKDPNKKLFVQVRTVELGTPTLKLASENARTSLEPSQIGISSDASVATNIKFPTPIHLEPNQEYALVFLSPASDNYEMWVATMGQVVVGNQTLPNTQSKVISKQYVGGSLFKSQNGSIWTASQYQDIKFKLYKADFTSTSGDVVFYNPPLRANENTIPYLKDNSVITYPRNLKVGITTTSGMNGILGKNIKVSYDTTNTNVPGATGYIDYTGGPLAGVTISSPGIAYSTGNYSNVPLYSITGLGQNALANITVNSSGEISVVSILGGGEGSGYAVGDILGITTSYLGRGSAANVSVTTVNQIDTLYLTNVQGEQFISGQRLIYYSGSTSVSCATTSIVFSSSYDDLYKGNVIQIVQPNHGMQADNNLVKINNIEPDTIPVSLTSNLAINDSVISIANTSEFSTFEGISTSRGYLKVGSEVIQYTSVGNGNLGIGTRGVDGTSVSNHETGSITNKYELNAISLTRINTTFNMPSNQYLKSIKDYDTYFLEIDRTTRSTGDKQLSFTTQKSVGGNKISASQNYQFNTINPSFSIITPGKNTSVTAQMRTVSGTSAGGNESSFLDQGYFAVELNKDNYLPTPRLICSEINEQARLTSIGSTTKSLTLRVKFNTTDSNLSPALDVTSPTFAFNRNRINNPIKDYAYDGRVNRINGDPHSAIYITNRVDLENPATSLKVLVAASRPAECDFRVLYRLFKSDSSEVNQAFSLFPGYGNVQDVNLNGIFEPIDESKNNGRPDKSITASINKEFKEYQFSIDRLNQFNGFQIKIVMSSTNEALYPRFQDLRVIALA